jgi:hypothetical protein
MPDLSPQDRDLITRTVIGEADDQSSEGQAAVAHVILNRLNSGQYGKGASDVILQRHAFEPWSTRARELSTIDPRSDHYQKVAQNIAPVLAGDHEDNTGGATHFLSPKIMASRGKPLPYWARGAGTTIGDHRFFAPDNPSYGGSALDAIHAAIGGASVLPGSALAFDEPAKPKGKAAGDPFKDAGFDIPTANSASTQAGSAVSGDPFKDAGFTLPGEKIAAPSTPASDRPPGASGYVEMPGSGTRHYIDAAGKFIEVPNYQAPSALSQVGQFASELPGRYSEAVKESAASSAALGQSGLEDLRKGLYGSASWKTPLGALGFLTSPLSGAINIAGQEIDKATGVPGTGEKAALVLPIPKAGAIANAVRPSASALSQLVADIGRENLPGVLKRLESNPTLALMDVAPGVQTRAMGIATGEPSRGQTQLFETAAQRVADRRNQTRSAFGETIGEPPNTVELLDKMKADARKVGTEQIEPALAGAKPVDVTGVVKAIDDEIGENALRNLRKNKAPALALTPIQQRLLELRQQLTYRDKSANAFPKKDQYFLDATGEPNAGAADAGAHGVQSRLRYQAETLLNSSGSDRLQGGTLMNIRGKLVDAIDEAANGKYRPALAAYRDEMHIQEAFDKGMSVTSGARTGDMGLENRPEAWEKWAKGATDKEMEAARLGARTVIDNTIGTIRQAGRAGTDIPDAPFTRAKLELLFGKQETDRLTSLLADEKAKAQTNALLTANSKTARSQAAQRETTPREVKPIGENVKSFLPSALAEMVMTPALGIPGLGAAGVFAVGGARKAGQAVMRARDVARNTAYAHLASTAAPEERNALLSVLRAHVQPPGKRNKVGNALSTLGRLPLPQ